jgi:nicotinate phosphoribosyltransferase
MGNRGRSGRLALATDLYELTMGATYHALGLGERATFSLFVRKLPPNRSYLVVAGVEEALARLQDLAFDEEALAFLGETGLLSREELERLRGTRFTGSVRAVPEGRVVFAGEPLLEVDAPIAEAQLAESLVMNAVHYPTLVATKAARCVAVAPGKTLVDFGLRRAPDIDAALAAARACYLAGFEATSNVLAGRAFGIPLNGTVAHSLIEAFPGELAAFRAQAATAPGGLLTLLVDTYDSRLGIARAVQVAKELGVTLGTTGVRLDAIRLDSGDLAELALHGRRLLDAAGLGHVRIFASGGLDEYELGRLVSRAAPIDGYGIGSHLAVSSDAAVMDMAYKIVSYAGRPTLKLSTGKATWIGPKQVWRRRGPDGRFERDRIAAADEPQPGAGWEPLLELVMSEGRALPLPSLRETRERHRTEMASMPAELLAVPSLANYVVEWSPVLTERQREAVAAVRAREGLE